MGDYPDVRADGANIEVELERGFTFVAYVGDPDVAALLEELWSLRNSSPVRIARLKKQFRQTAPRAAEDRELAELLAGLRRQIDEFEASITD